MGLGIPITKNSASRVVRKFRNGLVADFQASSLALADGAAVSSWASGIGGVTATQATSGSRPAFSATGWAGSTPAVSFVGTKHLRADSLAALANTGGKPGPMSVVIVCKADSTAVAAGASTVFGLGGPSAYRTQAGFANGVGSLWASQPVGNGLTVNGSAVRSDEITVLCAVFNGASSKLYINGQYATNSLAWNPWTDTSFASIGTAIAAAGTVANPFSGLIQRVIVYNRALGDSEWSAVVQSLRAQALMRHRLIGLGDSIMHGYGVAASWFAMQTLPVACMGSGSLRGVPIDKSQNGRAVVYNATSTTNNITDNLASDLSDGPYDSRAPSMIVVHAGTNDIAYGASAATTTTNYLALLDAVRVARPYDYIVAVTSFPRTGFVTETAAFASAVRSGYAAHADALWDAAAVPQFSNPANATYYQDGVHPTTAGHTILAADFAAQGFRLKAVNKMLRRMLG